MMVKNTVVEESFIPKPKEHIYDFARNKNEPDSLDTHRTW